MKPYPLIFPSPFYVENPARGGGEGDGGGEVKVSQILFLMQKS